jgi:hypothetical protein
MECELFQISFSTVNGPSWRGIVILSVRGAMGFFQIHRKYGNAEPENNLI